MPWDLKWMGGEEKPGEMGALLQIGTLYLLASGSLCLTFHFVLLVSLGRVTHLSLRDTLGS